MDVETEKQLKEAPTGSSERGQREAVKSTKEQLKQKAKAVKNECDTAQSAYEAAKEQGARSKRSAELSEGASNEEWARHGDVLQAFLNPETNEPKDPNFGVSEERAQETPWTQGRANRKAKNRAEKGWTTPPQSSEARQGRGWFGWGR